MNNVPRSIWEKKLPPFSGLVLVLAILISITWMTSNVVLFGTRAAIGGEPQKVQITNISDTSFTVSYQTEAPVLGSVRYGINTSLGQSILDDRDQLVNKAVDHRVHYFTVKNLTPGTKYLFEISSGGETYKNNGELYEVATAPPLTAQAKSHPPLTGQVELEDGTVPVEGVAYVTGAGSQMLSALLKPDGSYEIPLQNLRKTDLTSWAFLTETTPLNVNIEAAAQQSTAVVLAGQTLNTPLMILSKDYDFSLATDASSSATASGSGAVQPVNLPIPQDTTLVTSPKITVPIAGHTFNDSQPMFEGKAVPGTAVEVVMEMQPEISAVIQADEFGNWKYRPEAPLSPGNQTIIIKAQDSQGAQQSISQSFTVAAQGSQFVEPSISPPVQLPTPVELPTATPGPTIEPTATEAPTPTIAPTLTPDPNATMSPTIDPNAGKGVPNVPDSGTSTAWIFGIAGVVFAAGVGALLFFFI